MVTFRNRGSIKVVEAPETEAWSGPIDPEVYEEVRRVAPGWDAHYLEREWRTWLGENEIAPKHPERHLVKFCQTWFEKRGRP
jgi:hypothetical protein